MVKTLSVDTCSHINTLRQLNLSFNQRSFTFYPFLKNKQENLLKLRNPACKFNSLLLILSLNQEIQLQC